MDSSSRNVGQALQFDECSHFRSSFDTRDMAITQNGLHLALFKMIPSVLVKVHQSHELTVIFIAAYQMAVSWMPGTTSVIWASSNMTSYRQLGTSNISRSATQWRIRDPDVPILKPTCF